MNARTQTGRELKQELEKSLGLLKTLRDEIHVDLHLAQMDARDRWQKTIEPRIQQIELQASKAKTLSREIVNEAVRELKQFRDDLKMRRT